ncbi:hypothetical protein FCV25MIE_29166 [Fagus crenata]
MHLCQFVQKNHRRPDFSGFVPPDSIVFHSTKVLYPWVDQATREVRRLSRRITRNVILEDRTEFEGSQANPASKAASSSNRSSPSSLIVGRAEPFATLALKETVIDEGAEARVLRAVNHPIRSSSSLLTPFNLELHSAMLKLQESKDKGRETTYLSKMKAMGSKVVHTNPKKQKAIVEPSSLETRATIFASPQPFSPSAVICVLDSVLPSPLPSSKKDKEKEIPITTEANPLCRLLIHDDPEVFISRMKHLITPDDTTFLVKKSLVELFRTTIHSFGKAFCEFAAYGTHVNLLNKRLAAMIKQPI